MSLEQKDGDRVAVALFPVDYAPVEVVTDAGEEILQQLRRFSDFSESQLFLHSIQELERVRMEKKKTKKRKMGSSGESADEKKPRVDGEEKGGSPTPQSIDPADDQGDDIVMKEESAEVSKDAKKKEPAANGVETLKENGTSEHAEGGNDGIAVGDDVAGDASAGEEEEEEEEEEVIDPRIHYRPMVAELQGSIIELNQLINTIDLIRRREYLEDKQCIRENTVEKKDEMEYLVEAKAQQLKDSSNILLAGVDALTATVEKESNFFDGVSEMIRKWKICAPIHGNIPKPFRAGEPLAVDCSFVSAGSRFAPPTRSVADLSFAELSRTEKGLVCIKTPEEYTARTIQVELRSLVGDASGSYTLPAPKMSSMTRAMLDRLENTPDDLKTLEERNTSVLKAVQFSVFCEELFHTVMQEALWSSGNWSDSALSVKKPVAKKSQRNDDTAVQGPGNVSVVEILDDEIRLRLRDHYELTLRLLGARALVAESSAGPQQDQRGLHAGSHAANGHRSSKATPRPHTPHSEEEFLRETCRFAVLLLQQEIRERHGRNQISRGLLFTSADSVSATGAPQTVPTDADRAEHGGVLAAVVNTISHNLLQDEIARYLDELSAKLAYQNAQSSSTGRILEDGLNQPICDSVRGIYVSPRWKSCPHDSTLAAFDLSVGKNFTTEILISGTKIRFEDGPGTVREISTLSGLKHFVEKTICCQVAQALHRDFASLGLKQSSVDLDRTSVRLFVAGEWNGSSIGDGRVPDSKPTSCMYFEPYLTSDLAVSIKCVLQAVDTSSLSDELGTRRTNGKGESLYDLAWERIPGNSDMAKIVWLLGKTTGLPNFFAAPEAAGGVVTKTA